MTTTSPIFTTTYDTGGTAKAMDEVTVVPDRARTREHFADFAGGHLNGPFVADFLSAALMHEMCGRHLYRSVAGRTNNPMLKRRYEQFGQQTEMHIAALQELITALGGEPGYVSPSARYTEKLDTGTVEATFLLDGSLDILTRELLMLDAVVLAETIDHSNWELIASLARSVPEGPVKDAFIAATGRVQAQEDEHLTWAVSTRATLVTMQATRPMVAGAMATAEGAMEWFKGLFNED